MLIIGSVVRPLARWVVHLLARVVRPLARVFHLLAQVVRPLARVVRPLSWGCSSDS